MFIAYSNRLPVLYHSTFSIELIHSLFISKQKVTGRLTNLNPETRHESQLNEKGEKSAQILRLNI